MKADRARPASRPLQFAGVALVSILLAGCSGSGLESIDVSNPSYAAPTVAAADAPPPATDATPGVVPLTTEQEGEIGDAGASFVPMSRPAPAIAAAQAELPAAPQPAALAATVAPATAGEQAVVTAEAKAEQPPADGVQVAAATTTAPGQISASGFAPAQQPTDSVKKKGFLAGFFSQKAQDAPVMSTPAPAAPKPVIKLASAAPAQASLASFATEEEPQAAPSGNRSLGSDLPGVRKTSLFEITRKDSLDDDSDVDLHEDEEAPMQMASAAGLARLAPNGLLKQRENVDVSCLKPSLVRMLKQIENHYGRKMVVTSGYRSPEYNRRVRGARKSMHMYCAAVDVQLIGVSKWELARYTRSLPGRGGVGTYCHTDSVHIDIGPERDWNWRCRRRKG